MNEFWHCPVVILQSWMMILSYRNRTSRYGISLLQEICYYLCLSFLFYWSVPKSKSNTTPPPLLLAVRRIQNRKLITFKVRTIIFKFKLRIALLVQPLKGEKKKNSWVKNDINWKTKRLNKIDGIKWSMIEAKKEGI